MFHLSVLPSTIPESCLWSLFDFQPCTGCASEPLPHPLSGSRQMPPVSPAVRPAGRLPARKGGPPQSPVCVFGKVTSTQGAASVDSQEFSARKGSRRALTVTRRASSRPPRPRIRGPFERERGVPAHRLAVAARGSLLPRSPSRRSCVGLTAGKYSLHRRRRTAPSAGGRGVLR